MIGKESNWIKLKDLATGCIMRGTWAGVIHVSVHT